MAFKPEHVELACGQLTKRDRVMRRIIREVGPFTLKTQRNYFQILVRSIVSQQISTAAARTILQRLSDHLHPEPILPATLAKVDLETLRSLGLSGQKAIYAIDLTQRVASGSLNLKSINRRTDDQVIAELTQVKGIGVWTAHMFMIFALGRLDVLPVGDYGIRMAVQRAYALPELPKPSEVESIGESWRPYASIASWYLWRSLETKKK
jgi:DNA-3-methyladenine glycosylase II